MAAPNLSRLQSATMQQLADVAADDLLNTARSQVTMRDIVDGSVGGSTNDAVLRFNSANDSTTGTAMAIVHSAADGDSVLISQRGVYEVEFTFSQAAATTVALGISQDVAAAGLTTDPTMATAGTLDTKVSVLPAANTVYTSLTSTIYVTEALAATGSSVRAHGTTGGDAVVPDATILDNLECHMKVTRTGDLVA